MATQNNKNPYSRLLDIVAGVSAGNNNPAIQIGQVLAPPPNIKISYNGIVLEKEELYCNTFLLVGYPRTAKGHIVSATQNRGGGSGYAEYESHNHDINNDYTDTIILTDTLKAGDYVALMPLPSSVDNTQQQYIILCQIVHL